MTDVVPGGPAALLRALAATAVTSAAAGVLAAVVGRTVADLTSPGGGRLEAAVALVAMTAGSVALGVVAAGCLLTAAGLLARLAGRSFGRLEAAAGRITPLALRRVIAVGVGAGLVAAVAAPASAAGGDQPGPTGPDSRVAVVTTSAGELGWQITSPGVAAALPRAHDGAASLPEGTAPGAAPDTTSSSPAPAGTADPTGQAPGTSPGDAPEDGAAVPAPAGTAAEGASPGAPDPTGVDPVGGGVTAPSSAGPGTVTVRAGDSLWAIAAAHLPPGGTDADVAAAWPRWYAANRDTIGADPGLIHPGQVLVVPEEEA